MKTSTIDIIKQHCGNWNLDIAAGWEAGMLGRERVAGKLFNRHPPEHFYEAKNANRLSDWILGRDKAIEYREKARNNKWTFFSAWTHDGQLLTVNRRGWGVARGPIVAKLEKMGAVGDVSVKYYDYSLAEGNQVARTVTCGI